MLAHAQTFPSLSSKRWTQMPASACGLPKYKAKCGADTSKRSGPCGAVPGKHAVQQSGLRRGRSASEAFSQWLVPFALAWQALLGHSICWSWRKSLPLYPFLTSSVENLPEIKERNSSRGLVKLEPVYPSFLLRGQTQRQSCRWQSTLVLVSQVGLPSRPFPSSESLSLTNSNSFSPPPPHTHFFFSLSVQTRTMNSSGPQECDKVSREAAGKVMYGPGSSHKSLHSQDYKEKPVTYRPEFEALTAHPVSATVPLKRLTCAPHQLYPSPTHTLPIPAVPGLRLALSPM